MLRVCSSAVERGEDERQPPGVQQSKLFHSLSLFFPFFLLFFLNGRNTIGVTSPVTVTGATAGRQKRAAVNTRHNTQSGFVWLFYTENLFLQEQRNK